MSHYLIKRIVFKKDGVYFTAASNNIIPKRFYSERDRFFSEKLDKGGKSCVIKEILWSFSNGSFKPSGDNKNIKIFAEVAEKVTNTKEYEVLNNIYWCWDRIKRTQEEKELALKEIKNLLWAEYLKNTLEVEIVTPEIEQAILN
jgi:hypothetical protein